MVEGFGKGPDGEEWVFDERFVAGGIREDSLRRNRAHPDRRTPEPARNGLGNLPGPRDWSPQPQRRTRSRGRIVLLVLVTAVGVFGLVRYVSTRDDNANTPPIALSSSASASIAGVSESDGPEMGLSAATPAGTCLRGTARPELVDVRVAPCTAKHDFEVVAHERATGADDTYPTAAYWNGPVAKRCYADLRRYIGQPRSQWPDYLSSTQFVPRPEGWAAGDRVIHCIAEVTPAVTGTVAHLRPAHPSVIGTAGGNEPGSTTATGRLFVLTHGTDVCLGLRSPNYTGAIMSTARGLSWRAAVDDEGHPDQAGSGIARGPQAQPGTIRWHVGDRVTLHGASIPEPQSACGGTSVFGFDSVSAAG